LTIKIIKKIYKIKNREIINAYRRKYCANLQATNINYKILKNCRRRLSAAVKNNPKAESTLKLIGCTTVELKIHLANQFTEGMTFENYGEWQIDHIKPCTLFDFSKPEDQKKCFHFSNLQPLWAADNLKKSNKYEEALLCL